MITSVRFCLSYDLLNAILTPSKFVNFVYFNENLHCCNRRIHDLTCFRRKCYVTLFMTWRYRSGSVVECLTRDRGVVGSSLSGITVM